MTNEAPDISNESNYWNNKQDEADGCFRADEQSAPIFVVYYPTAD